MSIQYAYWGTYTTAAFGANGSTGYPTAATFNPYNSDTTVPVIDSGAGYTAPYTTFFGPDDVDRSAYASPTVLVVSANQGNAFYVIGGTATFRDALGIVPSATALTNPAQALLRYILLPNSHATPDGIPVGGPKNVPGNMVLPVPVAITAPPTIGTDPVGTPIVDSTNLASYSRNAGTFLYPFILTNAWTDSVAGPFVDTAAPIRWLSPSITTPSLQSRTQTATPSPQPVITASRAQLAFPETVITGYEDLDATLPAAPDFANVDFNDIVVGKLIFINIT